MSWVAVTLRSHVLKLCDYIGMLELLVIHQQTTGDYETKRGGRQRADY